MLQAESGSKLKRVRDDLFLQRLHLVAWLYFCLQTRQV